MFEVVNFFYIFTRLFMMAAFLAILFERLMRNVCSNTFMFTIIFNKFHIGYSCRAVMLVELYTTTFSW